jgi:DNA-binding MarR family transcriptional regulator
MAVYSHMDEGDAPSALTAGGQAVTQLVLAVFRLNGRLLASGDRLVADIGLSSARWQVLGAVALAGTHLPVAHIARNMGLARQSVQRLVDDLAADGLVDFAANPYHRRAKLVRLTELGKTAYRSAIERQVPWANRLAANLDADALKAAMQVVQLLIRRLEEAEEDRRDGTPSTGKGRAPA